MARAPSDGRKPLWSSPVFAAGLDLAHRHQLGLPTGLVVGFVGAMLGLVVVAPRSPRQGSVSPLRPARGSSRSLGRAVTPRRR